MGKSKLAKLIEDISYGKIKRIPTHHWIYSRNYRKRNRLFGCSPGSYNVEKMVKELP